MKRYVFSIFDRVSGIYQRPVFAENENLIKRDLSVLLNSDEKNQITMFTGDLSLYLIGSFDDISGELIPCDKPEFICNLIDLKKAGDSNAEKS